jgi:hypothetical protein
MKWLGLACLGLAVMVKLAWHSSYAVAFPTNTFTLRGYAVDAIVFWLLLAAGCFCLLFSFLRRGSAG